MSKYKRLFGVMLRDSHCATNSITIRLNPVDAPVVVSRKSHAQEVFDESVEAEIQELKAQHQNYFYKQVEGIRELSFPETRSIEESEHPTDVLMALNSSFEAPSIYRAVQLVRGLDCREDSTKEVLNVLGGILRLKKSNFPSSEWFLKDALFELEVEVSKKLCEAASSKSDFKLMASCLWELVALHRQSNPKGSNIALQEYSKWVSTLINLHQAEADSKLAFKTLISELSAGHASKVDEQQSPTTLTQTEQLRRSIDQCEISFGVLEKSISDCPTDISSLNSDG